MSRALKSRTTSRIHCGKRFHQSQPHHRCSVDTLEKFSVDGHIHSNFNEVTRGTLNDSQCVGSIVNCCTRRIVRVEHDLGHLTVFFVSIRVHERTIVEQYCNFKAPRADGVNVNKRCKRRTSIRWREHFGALICSSSTSSCTDVEYHGNRLWHLHVHYWVALCNYLPTPRKVCTDRRLNALSNSSLCNRHHPSIRVRIVHVQCRRSCVRVRSTGSDHMNVRRLVVHRDLGSVHFFARTIIENHTHKKVSVVPTRGPRRSRSKCL
jgi:hypothetical protein